VKRRRSRRLGIVARLRVELHEVTQPSQDRVRHGTWINRVVAPLEPVLQLCELLIEFVFHLASLIRQLGPVPRGHLDAFRQFARRTSNRNTDSTDVG
jgi:hypothetical protein